MKIVVFGALGHIGSQLVRDFASDFRGAEIVMVDNMMTQRYCSLFNLPEGMRYRFIEADVLNLDLSGIIRGADVVIQLAAITNAAGSFEIREQVEYNNFNTSRVVAEACAATGSPLIHLSSTSVYGTTANIVDEFCSEEELKPQSPYAETKLKEERFLQMLAREKGLRFVTLRFGTICGISPGMRFHTAVNKFCWQAVLGQPLTVWRTALHQKRPYLSLVDAVAAFKFIINNNLYDSQVYNVLTENLTVDDIVKMISSHLKDIKLQYTDSLIMNQLSYEVACSRIVAKGFSCQGKIQDTVADAIRLLKQANS